MKFRAIHRLLFLLMRNFTYDIRSASLNSSNDTPDLIRANMSFNKKRIPLNLPSLYAHPRYNRLRNSVIINRIS